MCNEHSNVLIEIPGASERGPHGRKRAIDGCIAPLVGALNAAGLTTIASCCGHGHRPGTIILEDGREIIIARNYAEGRKVDGFLDELYRVSVYGEKLEGLRGEPSPEVMGGGVSES